MKPNSIMKKIEVDMMDEALKSKKIMTRQEEILSEVFGYHFDNETNTDIAFSLHKKAMEIFAKEQSIAFDQWKHDNKWVQYTGFDTPTFHRGGKPEPGVQFYFSSSELYQLFIDQTK